ncbi:MAG: T9SS type A sorting domain-containing protein [Phaeodactylibacter sp.]|nr:T9SS type A sorting domain-containing protein [Phaeodactylibacter sp.]MCB9301461.1 T9SS type A sorting domain-containing protein [Lewinellaceae bacterium]
MRLFLLLGAVCALSFGAAAQTVFFYQDSNNPGYYDTGLAFPTSPSFLEQAGPSGDKIPVEYDIPPYEGNNSLRIRWQSQSGGDWSALVIAPGFPFQNITNTDTLSFWAYAPEAIAAGDWPLIFMEGAPGATKSRKYALGPYAGDLPAGQWKQVKIPLSLFFDDPNQSNINFSQTKAIIFGQDAADGVEHTLLIDEVKTYNGSMSADPVAAPEGLTAAGYDSHVELNWTAGSEPQLAGYRIYRSTDNGQSFQPLRYLSGVNSRFIDFVRPLGANLNLQYRIAALNTTGQESPLSNTAVTSTFDMTDDQLLDMVQQYTFRYFWDFAHPVSGLIRERNTSGDVVTMGGTGFGVMAILVGIERGFITRQQGMERIQQMAAFLGNADRFHGAFPHWMNGATGQVHPFSTQDDGGDIVETAFLFEGLLTAREYFNLDTPEEAALREQITQLWEAVEWNWYRKQNQNVIFWHWSPNYNYAINLPVRGWNETMMVYLLAIASPTEGVPAGLYHSGWAGGNYASGLSYYGFQLPVGTGLGGPLFFTQYSFLGFDPRDKRDQYANYFIQGRNQSLINRAYCISNPLGHEGYNEFVWGLTASDDPLVGYLAHEPQVSRDNGTMAPTGALSAMPYTPTQSIATLKYYYRQLGHRLWGPMGFYDAFHLGLDWYADSYLAIDQGPIICMIENYRTQLLWNHFMANPEIQDALDAIGFVPDTTVVATETPSLSSGIDLSAYPNPAQDKLMMELAVAKNTGLSATLLDSKGNLVIQLIDGRHFAPGNYTVPIDTRRLSNGVYFLQVRTEQTALTRRIMILK